MTWLPFKIKMIMIWQKNALRRTLTPSLSLWLCKLLRLTHKVSLPTQLDKRLKLPKLTQIVKMTSKTQCSRRWSRSRLRSKLETSWRASESSLANHRLLMASPSKWSHTRLTHLLQEVFPKTWTNPCTQRKDTSTLHVMVATCIQSLVSATSAVFSLILTSVRIVKRPRTILMLSWKSKKQDRHQELSIPLTKKRSQRLRPKLNSIHPLWSKTFLDLWVECQELLQVVSSKTSDQASILTSNLKLNQYMVVCQVCPCPQTLIIQQS